jgi:glutathione synthase/RimK-type ligase-like ATP-grasp enzyme
MILIFGCGDDSCIEMAVSAARELGISHRFVDQRTLGDDDALHLRIGSRSFNAELTVGGEVIDLGACTAVYARALGVAATEGARRLTRTFNEWLDITDALVANRPFAMRSNGSKPFQAQLIARSGFRVPETLVTNQPAEVIDFAAAHGRLIYKSVSGIRSIVRELDVAADLKRIRGLATQFQALIEGDDVRVHVVGDEVFATEVRTEAVDYRYAARDGRDVEHLAVRLDAETEARCVALARVLDLPLCGIDLRRTASGDYVCFEVNPMPAFSYYEGLTGQPIARSLVSALAAA